MEIRPEKKYVAPARDLEDSLGSSIDETRVQGTASFDPFRTFALSLARFGLLGAFIAMVLFVGGIALWIIQGAAPVRQAAQDLATAESAYFAALNQSQPVIQQLAVLGAPSDHLETVYFAYVDASRADRPAQADVLLQVMQDQAATARSMGQPTDEVYRALYPASQARAQVSDAYRAWVTALEPLPARLAVALGMARTPSPRIHRYSSAPKALPSRAAAPR